MQCYRTRKIVNAIRKTTTLARLRNPLIDRHCTERWDSSLEQLDFVEAQITLRYILRLVPVRTIGRVYEFGGLDGSEEAIFIAGLLVLERRGSGLLAVRNLMAAFGNAYGEYTILVFNFSLPLAYRANKN